jgi:hypothetical protein
VIRTLLPLTAAALAVVAAQGSVAHARPAAAKQRVVATSYEGKTARALDFGSIRLKPGNKVAPLWRFTNGVAGQHDVIDAVPGEKGYSPLWKVRRVSWVAGKPRRVLASADAVRAAASRGDVTIRATATVVNEPVLGFGQTRITGYSAGRAIHYYDLGAVAVRPGNEVVPLYAVTNGVAGQHNVTGDTVAPGQTAYPPLWAIAKVTWKPGVTPRLLTSYAAIASAAAAGRVTTTKTALVVNCPLI